VVAGYLSTRSLFAAAALATAGETIGFYGCVGVKTAVAASRVTAHLAGWRRLAAAAWHAVTQQLASCAAAEALDDLLIRPGCLAVGWWLLRPLPGGVWLGFAVGKAAADVAWYGMEACARRGVAAFIKGRQPTTRKFRCPSLVGFPNARGRWHFRRLPARRWPCWARNPHL
jgi:hypothetical protein